MVLAAIGQICSTASMSNNLAQCQILIRKAVSAGAKALFLPEASDYIATSPTESLSLCKPTTTSPFIQGLQKSALDHKISINVGIHEPTTPPSSRIRNTLIWINPEGQITHRYQKIHLFDIDLSSTNGPVLKESNSTEPGNDLPPPYQNLTVDPEGEPTILGPIGSQICFDMRFPEPALHLRRQGAKILLYPSAFTVPTGKLHWEVLLRARAIENQCYVIAAAQCGRHNSKRVSYGDSLVVDPNGVVVGRLERVVDVDAEEEGSGGNREPGLLLVDLDMELVESVRRGIPLRRRGDVYAEV